MAIRNGSTLGKITLANIPAGNAPSTTMVWLYIESTTGSDTGIFSHNGNCVVYHNGSTPAIAFYAGGTLPYTLALGTWYHIALVIDASNNATLYVDGVSRVTATGVATTFDPVFLSDAYDEHADERQAAIKCWGAALTQAEVQNEMRFYMPQRTANLLFWIPGTKYNDLADYSGNGRSGTASVTMRQADGPPIAWRRGPSRIFIPAAVTAINGTSSVTLAAAASSAAGQVAVSGAASQTLAGATLSATGTTGGTPITGDASVTLAAATSSAAGTVAVAGAASRTLAAATSSAAGAVAVQGTATVTLANATLETAPIAIRFDASGEAIDFGTAYLDGDYNGATIMAWFYIVNDRGADSGLVEIRGAGLAYIDGSRHIALYDGEGVEYSSGIVIPLGEWHHVALTRTTNPPTWTVFLDGTPVVSDTTTTPTGDVHIIFGTNKYGDWFDGREAYGRVWLAELSQTEIQVEMTSAVPIRTANIYYANPFNNPSDVSDQSGQGNNPSIIGTLSAEAGPTLPAGAVATITLASATSSAAGTVALSGAASVTLANATTTATGAVAVTGSESTTLGNATASAAGAVAVQGSLAAALAAATASAAGTVPINGAAAVSLNSATAAAAGAVAITGAASVTLASATLSASTSADANGSASIQLTSATLNASGAVAIGASMSVTLGAATLSAAGTAQTQGSGTADVGLSPATLAAAGQVAISCLATPQLAHGTVQATGAVAIKGSAAPTLTAGLTATGQVALTGHLAATLAGATICAVAFSVIHTVPLTLRSREFDLTLPAREFDLTLPETRLIN